jgi:hypothetical protein
MDDVLHEFFVWCVQFAVVSTVFLTTSYWLLGRSRRLKALKSERSQNSLAQVELKVTEAQHVAHGT